MILPASEIRKKQFEKKFCKQIELVSEKIQDSIINFENKECKIEFDDIDWESFSYLNMKFYLEELGYKVYFNVFEHSFYEYPIYVLTISWSRL